jgi:uncharacterized protein YqkB
MGGDIMSISTSIHVGYYIIAKLKPIFRTETDVQCSKKAEHKLKGDEDFCPKCGSKVVEVTREEANFQSMLNVLTSDDSPLVISDDDRAFLEDEFCVLDGEYINQFADEEILTVEALNQYVDGDMPWITELKDPYTDENRAMLPDLNRLKTIMEYESMELKWGVIVSIG